MIPQRTLAGTCEITTGALAITQRPPIYTGENAALKVEVSFTFQNVAYQIPSGVEAEMYLKFPNTEKMTVAVPMEISGNTASGVLSGEQTGLEGYPLLIIQLTDTETASLIVACATTVKVSNVRGNLVVDTRAPTPSEIIYVGRSPYIDPTTKHWITWDSELAKYVDTGINAEGVVGYTPSISIGTVQSVPTGESAEVTRTGTDENPVFNFKLPRSGDGVGIYPVSIPIPVAEWVEESGVYKYTFPDATIKSYMTVLESWLDDEAVQLGKVWYTVNNGSLVVNTDVVPTAAWALHVTLGTDGTDVLEDVADLESRFPVSIANGGTGGTTPETARQALGITSLIDEKADIPVIVSVTVDTDGASMSAADLAKLTSDMIMCWYYGDRTKLKADLSILPGNGQQPTGEATSQTTFTIAFIHSANESSVASIIPMAGIPSTATVSIFFTIPSVADGTNCYSASVYIGYGKQLVPSASSQTHMDSNGVHLAQANGFARIYVSSSSSLKGGSYNIIGNITNA